MTLGAIPRSVSRPSGGYREALAAAARKEYERGQSIRDISGALDRSYSFARRLLLRSGVVLRPSATSRGRADAPVRVPTTGSPADARPAAVDLAGLLLEFTTARQLTISRTAVHDHWLATRPHTELHQCNDTLRELERLDLIRCPPAQEQTAATITVLNRNKLRAFCRDESAHIQPVDLPSDQGSTRPPRDMPRKTEQ